MYILVDVEVNTEDIFMTLVYGMIFFFKTSQNEIHRLKENQIDYFNTGFTEAVTKCSISYTVAEQFSTI